MNRLKTTVAMLGAGAMALSLTACGGDDSSEYCDLLKSANEELSGGISQDNPETVAAAGDTFKQIADAAPSAVQEDWQTMSEMVTTLADVDMSDPAAVEELKQLESVDMEAVNQRINDNVKDECDMQLGL